MSIVELKMEYDLDSLSTPIVLRRLAAEEACGGPVNSTLANQRGASGRLRKRLPLEEPSQEEENKEGAG